MFYLSKILPFFVLPLGIVFLLSVLGLVFRRKIFVIGAMVLLYLSSLPLTGRIALSAIESGMERQPVSKASPAEAIVVLSGGRTIAPGEARISEWTDANRFFGGVELFHAGKAPLLVFTGGWAPWEPDALPEGEILAGYAALCGVPEKSIQVSGKVLNTEEESKAVREMFKEPSKNGEKTRILLVTSAFHMPRAVGLFETAGFEVEPYPVQFLLSSEHRLGILDLLPSPSGLAQTTHALREFYGRAFVAIFKQKEG